VLFKYARLDSNQRARFSASRSLRASLRHWIPNSVRPAGLEPATLGLEIPCSIHLSYGRVIGDDPRSIAFSGRVGKCGVVGGSRTRGDRETSRVILPTASRHSRPRLSMYQRDQDRGMRASIYDCRRCAQARKNRSVCQCAGGPVPRRSAWYVSSVQPFRISRGLRCSPDARFSRPSPP